jgi:mRNA interferase RelE/StbE
MAGRTAHPGFHGRTDRRAGGSAKLAGPILGVFWRYRVGDCRIICDIQDGALRILVIEIGDRKSVYR